MPKKTYTHAEWKADAVKRFGENPANWKFVCPSCGFVATVEDWKKAGAPDGAAAFSCIGRYTGSKKTLGDKTGGPCNYTGGGLFQLNPVEVDIDGEKHSVFDFAEASNAS